MNSILKNLALLIFLCLCAGVNAQALKTATVTQVGLIVLDNSTPDLVSEYVADISHLNLRSETSATDFFKKYINYTTGRGISYHVDFANQRLYIFVDVNGQMLVPLSNVKVNTNNMNDILRWIHQGII